MMAKRERMDCLAREMSWIVWEAREDCLRREEDRDSSRVVRRWLSVVRSLGRAVRREDSVW